VRGGSTSWGVVLSSELEELLEGLCQVSSLGLADFIDRRWAWLVTNNDSSFSSAAFSARPVISLLRRWQTLVFFLCIVAVGVFTMFRMFSIRARLLAPYSVGPFKHYRLETTLTRNGLAGTALDGPGLSKFGLLGLSRPRVAKVQAHDVQRSAPRLPSTGWCDGTAEFDSQKSQRQKQPTER